MEGQLETQLLETNLWTWKELQIVFDSSGKRLGGSAQFVVPFGTLMKSYLNQL